MRPRRFVAVLALTTATGCVPTDDPADSSAPATATATPLAPSSTTGVPAPATAPLTADPDLRAAATPDPCPEQAAVQGVSWTEAEGGTSLAVIPSDALRACAHPLLRWESDPPGWGEVVSMAGPEADSAAMRQQYACHLRFARGKDVWRLEPWRPLVGEEQLLADRCNPSGS